MNTEYQIPEPFLFNPLKHHLLFMRDFIGHNIDKSETDINKLIKELKHIGTSVMDVYSGGLTVSNICKEAEVLLKKKKLITRESFSAWAGTDPRQFKIISLSDDSHWIFKYHDHNLRFVHIFPARNSPHSFRVKSNTLKSALLYYIIIGKDYITADDLNKVRPFLGLSAIKTPIDTEAIIEMIEILRD